MEDLLRNDLDYRNPVLFALPGLSDTALPGRRRYVWDGIGGPPAVWTRDPEAPVQAVVVLDGGPAVIGRDPGPGWLVTYGRNRCWSRLHPIPGQRGGGWAAFGPCPGETGTGRVARPDSLPAEIRDSIRTYAHYRSFLTVDEPGRYLFSTVSDDGSILRVNGEVVVDNAARQHRREKTGHVLLSPGTHAVSVSYFNHLGGSYLAVSVRGPGGREIPRGRFTTQPPD